MVLMCIFCVTACRKSEGSDRTDLVQGVPGEADKVDTPQGVPDSSDRAEAVQGVPGEADKVDTPQGVTDSSDRAEAVQGAPGEADKVDTPQGVPDSSDRTEAVQGVPGEADRVDTPQGVPDSSDRAEAVQGVTGVVGGMDLADFDCPEKPLWRGEIFEQGPYIYNNDLAYIAADWSEKVDNEENIKAALRECGFMDSQVYNNTAENSIDGCIDSSVFAVGYTALEINGETTLLVAVIGRGTKNFFEAIGDWQKDNPLKMNKGYIRGHRAYDNVYDFYSQMMAGLYDFVHNRRDIMTCKNVKLLITGHSLGGAAANLLGAEIIGTASNPNEIWFLPQVRKEDVYVYTFGAIKAIDEDENVTEGFENIHNIYNYYDTYGPNGIRANLGVSSPESKFGHTEIYQDASLYIEENPFDFFSTENHWMQNYKAAIEKNRTHATIKLSCPYLKENGSGTDGAEAGEHGDTDGSGSNGADKADAGENGHADGSGGNGADRAEVGERGEEEESGSDGADTGGAGDDSSLGQREEFSIEGSWKSIGAEGFGQAQPGATVTFDGQHCNFYSPYDSYSFFESDGSYKLSCKNMLWQDTLFFNVVIDDADNIRIYYGSIETVLTRVK
ncbi:MAG: hypothetical protein MJ131_11650 [Lachnospiraceae bacterium]|nr:hypothetical protein [Lachnospiraceae bacterium]